MSSFIDTRDAWHRLARFVLAAELEGTTDLVTLRVTAGGFGQPERLVDGLQRRLRIDGTQLVVQLGENETWTPITTLAAAARLAAISLSGEAPEPDAELAVDPDHTATLAAFYAVTDTALATFRRRHATEAPTIVQLFPHHFDVAITVSQVNLGGSPGDADHELPYLYVGPWNLPSHTMWNEPWGASMPWTESTTVEQTLTFFEDGLAAATSVHRARGSQ